MPPVAQVAVVASCAFFGSLCGLFLLIHGRRAWYDWRREVWLRRNLWPDGEEERRERARLNGLVEVRRERLH